MNRTNRRRKSPKGTWMKLISHEVLKAHMEHKKFSVQRLATYAGCSKAFIGFLRTGDKTSCTKELAEKIALALDLPLEALFVTKTSAGSGQNTKRPVRNAA